MKIALIGPTYPFRGGISHYTSFLYEELSCHHDTTVISFRRQYPRLLFPGRSDVDPSTLENAVPAERLLDSLDPLSWARTVARLRSLRPDVVVMQWWVPYWAPAFGTIAHTLRLPPSPRLVYICHNVLPHESFAGARLLARFALSLASGYVVHSRDDESGLVSLFGRASIERCPLPTYGGLPGVHLPGQAEARRALGLAVDNPVLLFFGFVRPYKGLHTLLRAMPSVRRSLPAHLLIVGEFWEPVGTYRREIDALGLEKAVTIVDRYVPNDELGTYFAAADVAVLPYETATQSAVVQLAFGLGLPVIATDVGGLSEAVEHGCTGLLVPKSDPSALAQAILSYFHSNMGPGMRLAIAHSVDRFAWRSIREAIERLSCSGRQA